jgi:glucokinase
MTKAAIGVDIGGTRIKAVALNQSMDILGEEVAPTFDGNTNDATDTAWKNTIYELVYRLKERYQLSDFTVGISAPGIADLQNQSIAVMPGRLAGLEGFVWTDFLKVDTWVVNDAVAALNAELCLGAAKNKQNAVLITLGTGVGGALLINGKIYQGSFQTAGHLGHITTYHEGTTGITGMPGSLEDAIGNATIAQRSMGRFSSTKQLLDATEAGDYFAQWLWLASVRKLAIGIASLNNILSPQCIIIGGGIAEANERLFDPLAQFLSLYNWNVNKQVEILKATQADMSGAVGAACFALTH